MGTIVFATGCWQIIQAAAALRSDDAKHGRVLLILFTAGGRGDGDKETEAFAQKVYPWGNIFWAGDSVIPPLPSKDAIKYSVNALRCLAKSLGVMPNEIWLAGIHRQHEKAILCAFSNAIVCLFEDGLASYYNHEVTCGWKRLKAENVNVLSWLKRELTHGRKAECINLLGICSRDIKRVRNVFLSLTSVVDSPQCWRGIPVVDVSSRLLFVIKQCQEASTVKHQLREEKTVLCLGGRLHDVSSITFEDICKQYGEVIQNLNQHGYRIIWKDHPVTKRPFYEDVVAYTGIAMELMPANRTVELELCGKDVYAVIGGLSSSLLNLKVLYGLQTYSCLRKNWVNKLNSYDAWVAGSILDNVWNYKKLFQREFH